MNKIHRFIKPFFIYSIYGKCLESVRKRTHVRLLNDARTLRKCIAKPHLKNFRVFHDALVAVQYSYVTVTLNKPIHAGMCLQCFKF